MKHKKLKSLPKFKNEDEERKFWETHSSIEYLDWSKAKFGMFLDARPTTQTISIRFPKITLFKLKQIANKLDVPYQALIKQYVDAGLNSKNK